MIRKARLEDIDRVAEIYAAIHDAEEKGLLTIGWDRQIYPLRQTAADALDRGDLFVLERDGIIAAAGIINRIQVPEYKDCRWENRASDSEVMVLHTLAVDPKLQSGGCGREFVKFYEEYARENRCLYLRMDTNVKNIRAREFYKKLGFTEPGIVSCVFNGIPDVRLVCLEKKL